MAAQISRQILRENPLLESLGRKKGHLQLFKDIKNITLAGSELVSSRLGRLLKPAAYVSPTTFGNAGLPDPHANKSSILTGSSRTRTPVA